MLIFIVPVYNEEENIKKLLECTRRFAEEGHFDYQIIVVNDGSVDGTMQILKGFQEEIPLVVLDQVSNKGAGEAFKRGFAYVAEIATDEDIIISKEADNTSDLSVLSEMINKLNMGYDLVLASCYLEGGGVEGTAVHRKLLSFCANLLLRITTPLKDIHTFSSFYRVYRASLIKKACEIYGDTLIQEKGFSCMVELLLKLAKLRIKIAEVPMILQGNLRVGKSKMKTLDTTIGFLRLIVRNLLTKQTDNKL
jgi:dolichol-phosphate mannosyltransferase